MKILPVNMTTKSVCSNTNFKGLWGKTTHDSHSESEYFINDTKYEYYPFKDETNEQIQKVKKETERYKESVPGKGIVGNPWTHVDSVIVAVMTALPFTSKEFRNYTLNRLPVTKQSMIEKHIIGKGLSIIKK